MAVVSRRIGIQPTSAFSARLGELVRARGVGLEIIGLLAVLATVALTYTVRLGSVIVSDMDEGTYLYAGRLLTQGLVPYRDFLLAHPPLVSVLAAIWQSAAGPDIMSARFAYMALVLASAVPLYLLTREVGSSRLAGLLAVVSYTTGMLLLANMGRTIRLEPIMNAFLVAGAAAYLLRHNNRTLVFLAGVSLAAAVLVKLVAVVPIALLLAAEVLFWRRDRSMIERLTLLAAGAVVVLVPAGAWLLAQPHFVDDVIVSQLLRPGLPLATRAYFLWQDFTRYPLIPFALGAGVWWLIRSPDARTRSIALIAVGSTIALVALFRTFFGYYLVQVLPWLSILFACMFVAVAARVTRRWKVLTLGALVLLGVAAPVGYAEYYYRTARDHVSSPAQIVALLREGTGYIYTMYPSFALWSGRPMYPWYFQADALVPRLNGQLDDDAFVRAFAGSQALVLYEDELADYPRAQAYVKAHFQLAYDDSFYSLWVR
jgi:4-amino-4-deoxy-L-arabinose transferase-like glycosyltransferase